LRPGWLDGVSETHLKEAAAGVSAFKRARACSFFNRCAVRIENRCDQETPPIRRLSKGTEIRCQHTEAELLAVQEIRDQSAR
jgi:peptide/nickel transport system ATP-binding protein